MTKNLRSFVKFCLNFKIYFKQKTTYHPLSINLITRNVWCDLCKVKVNLEFNNPPFTFSSYHIATASDKRGKTHKHTKIQKNPFSSLSIDDEMPHVPTHTYDSNSINTNFWIDDYDLISYLDQENSNLLFLCDLNRSWNEKKTDKKRNIFKIIRNSLETLINALLLVSFIRI